MKEQQLIRKLDTLTQTIINLNENWDIISFPSLFIIELQIVLVIAAVKNEQKKKQERYNEILRKGRDRVLLAT